MLNSCEFSYGILIHGIERMAEHERELLFSPDARRQLSQLRVFDRRRITDAIRQQLLEADPNEQTRNKFALDPPADCADYELRVGNLRVFYRVEEEETEDAMRIIVALIGRKVRNKLFVDGEEFEL